jgi:hypothetical protein
MSLKAQAQHPGAQRKPEMNAAATLRTLAAAAILLAGSTAAHAWSEFSGEWLDVIYVPTPHQVVKRMLEIANVGPGDIHYDLGSGDGRIAIASVKDFSAKKSVGIDLDPQRIKESLENLAKADVGERVTFLNRNIFETDFSEGTIVSLYLLNRLNIKLRPTLLDMRPGTRIVTQTFTMNEWEWDYMEKVAFEENGTKGIRNVYLYVVPAKIEGQWALSDGTRNISLEIKQQFQRFSGTAIIGGKKTDIKNGRMNGTAIEFSLEVDGKPATYEGKVDGNTITGTNWHAKKAS